MPSREPSLSPGAVSICRPWSQASTNDGPIGELWFERPDPAAPETALLLKLLFTTEPLSIQVHPDDAFARSIGLANGKTEAWYILSAMPGAQVAVGLNASAFRRRIANRYRRMARSPTSCIGTRFIEATSFSFPPEPFMRSAPASFSPKSSSTATRRSGCLTMDGNVNCTSTMPSPSQQPDLGESQSPPRTLSECANGPHRQSSLCSRANRPCHRVPSGRSTRRKRAGFSLIEGSCPTWRDEAVARRRRFPGSGPGRNRGRHRRPAGVTGLSRPERRSRMH